MKRSTGTRFFLPSLIACFSTSLSVQASDWENQSFQDCMASRFYQKGLIRLVVDSSLLKNPDEAFKLYDDFSFSYPYQTGFTISFPTTTMGYAQIDKQTNQEVIKELRIIEGKIQSFSESIDPKTGVINLEWLKGVDEKLDALKKKYPAIVRSECVPPAPGPGVRVGG